MNRAGNQFFARAGLAGDQNAGVGRQRPWICGKAPFAEAEKFRRSPRTSMPYRFLRAAQRSRSGVSASACLRSSISVAATYQRVMRPCSSRSGLLSGRGTSDTSRLFCVIVLRIRTEIRLRSLLRVSLSSCVPHHLDESTSEGRRSATASRVRP